MPLLDDSGPVAHVSMYNARMVITGTLSEETHDGRTAWHASAFSLGVTGSGATRRSALAKLALGVEELVEYYMPSRSSFEVTVEDDGESTIFVSANDTTRLIALLLRDQRGQLGMSLAEVAEEAGAKSRNGYAQYEQGKVMPTLSKLQEMLDIVAPELVLAIIPRTARVLPREEEIEPEFDRLVEDPSPTNLAAWVAVTRVKDAEVRRAAKARREARAQRSGGARATKRAPRSGRARATKRAPRSTRASARAPRSARASRSKRA